MPESDTDPIEHAIQNQGRRLWNGMRDARPSIFAKDFWTGKLLDWSMRDPDFKRDLFRLIDVLPSLHTTESVSAHLEEYLLDPGHDLPPGLETAMKLGSGRFLGKVAASTLRKGVTEMAHRFIAGASMGDATRALRALERDGFAFSLDLLGEATLSEQEATAFAHRYEQAIDTLADDFTHTESDLTRPRANISIKITALEPHLDPADPEGSVTRALPRVAPLVERAREHNIFVNLDMEQYAYHEITYALLEALCDTDALRAYPHLGVVVQAYGLHAPAHLDRLHDLARRRDTPLTVRLVKGAYWDYELIHADQHGQTPPVFTHKAATDAAYERLSAWLVARREYLRPAFASHNVRSLAHALAQLDAHDAAPDSFEFQTLYGMAEPLREALRNDGYTVRVYTPIGALLPGMAYLVRRLLENTANEGFLRLTYHADTPIDDLLAAPRPPAESPLAQRAFRNCPHTDFANPDAQRAFARAVDTTPKNFPIDVPIVIGGETLRTDAPVARRDPAEPDRVVAAVHYASPDRSRQAVDRARDAWPAWRDTPLPDRVACLERLANRLEEDRLRLAALQVYEAGKPWAEADADVTEAVDFCRYYADRAHEELGPQPVADVFGERNALTCEGRGPAVIIAPWNFPLAIVCGMTSAALVAGNTVVMKPAEQASAIAYALFQHIQNAGFPNDAVQFLPGNGEVVGPVLVEHPDIALIGFTGSMAVGLDIIRRAGETGPNQRQIKRVVCEMGGKNAIVVDQDADLDEAVAGVLHSAFAYAGQKCSAASRVIAVGTAYATFIDRLVAATESLAVGPPADPSCQIPPVIDEDAHKRLLHTIDNPGDGARLLYRSNTPAHGLYVPPAIFEICDAKHRLMQEELFGPVLAVCRAETYDEALDRALDTRFALTGAVYSRLPSHLDRARRRFRVGNLYLNRGSTGSMVGRQAFGGFNMSGVGTKAGGPGYLRNFADPRSTTENTARRGFAPEVSL